MLLRLVGQRLTKQRLERLSASQRRAQIDFVIPEETRAQAAIRGESHAIARRAVRVRHRRNDADRSARTFPLVIRGRTVALRWTRCGREWCDGAKPRENVVARHDMLPRERTQVAD